MDNLKHVRQQGRDAKKRNDDNTDAKGNVIDTGITMLSAHDCPYGPGELRDAWMAGFGGQQEAVEQVDTSPASSEDVRTDVTAEQVREGAKPKKGKKAADQTKVVTDVTGTGETSLQTRVVPANPEASDQVPAPETIIGDPAASQGPGDANVMHPDESAGDDAASSSHLM